MKKSPKLPASCLPPTFPQLSQLLKKLEPNPKKFYSCKGHLSREEVQRILRQPSTRGPQLILHGEKPPTILNVTRTEHPSKIVKSFPDLIVGHGIDCCFGSPPDGNLDLAPSNGFYQLCRPPEGIAAEPNWDIEGHLAVNKLVACDVWDLLAWYQHVGIDIKPPNLPPNWRIVTTTHHGFNETGHYYMSSAQFIFAVLSIQNGKFRLGFNQYPTSYDHHCWTDNAYILGRHDIP